MIASAKTIKTEPWMPWCVISVLVAVVLAEVVGLNGDHVCVVQQKYNITKRVKYRAPMSVRTYEWCFNMPPRCSKWSTEMRDLTRLETEERTAEVAVCCPGYKMKDIACVPICPNGRTGSGCSEECPKNKWGPNCVNECKKCAEHGTCSPITGDCRCQSGWQGERCEVRQSVMSTVEELSVTKPVTKPTLRTEESTTLSTIESTTTSAPVTSTIMVPITPVATTRVSVAATITTTLSTTQKPTIASASTATSSTSTTTLRNIATTILINDPTSIVETTLQTSKTASVDPKVLNKEQDKTTEHQNFNNSTFTAPWTFKTHKSVFTTLPSFNTVNPVFMEPTLPTNITETATATNASTIRKMIPTIGPSELPMASTKTIDISTSFKVAKPIHVTDSTLKEATRVPETTFKFYPTTIKFKPKEIWIKPAQKGELLVDTKIKPNGEAPKYKNVTKETTTSTTPRTIMVSIIPTSMSYATFKKIALTTSSYIPHIIVPEKPTEMLTRPMSSTLAPTKPSSTVSTKKPLQNATASIVSKPHFVEDSKYATNSMSTIAKQPSLTTIFSTSTLRPKVYKTSTKTYTTIPSKPILVVERVTEHVTVKRNNTPVKASPQTEVVTDNINVTKIAKNTNVTDTPDEEIHVLTEPEHITAVKGDKRERSSLDLISVLSIAGGVMMTVITVAVVIVMLERCKRPRYEEKMNSIRMQVMIDNNDGPPPYVRNIFNTPLPEPPRTEKCHYQPISTLDRNLKQFMRPVVVQTISPMMLENFRGILECHYDHLPRRSVEYPTLQSRCSVAPSLSGCDELRLKRPDSLAETAIEALKCEAKLDVIDNTTSEPLYAEIPCWRPPSEHAIEVVNLNGEAVTEL